MYSLFVAPRWKVGGLCLQVVLMMMGTCYKVKRDFIFGNCAVAINEDTLYKMETQILWYRYAANVFRRNEPISFRIIV